MQWTLVLALFPMVRTHIATNTLAALLTVFTWLLTVDFKELDL